MKPLEMKFKVGDKVRSTIEGIEGEFVVSEMQIATSCYRVHRDYCKSAEFWIHEKDLEAVPKYKVGDRVRIHLLGGGSELYGVIESKITGGYTVSCKFDRFEREITPV